MSSERFRVAMVAPPWIEVPPTAYGGVEAAIAALVEELQVLGHEVELFTVGTSTARTTRTHFLYSEGRYPRIFSLLYEVAAVPIAHLLYARELIRQDGLFDVVHDHNYLLGPALLCGTPGMPPVLHTLHGPFVTHDAPDGPVANIDAYERLAQVPGVYFAGISSAQVRSAPVA